MKEQKFVILNHYTGARNIQGALKDPESLKLLWLEIVLNDSFNWEFYLKNPQILSAYKKACIWYHSFRTMIEQNKKRKPLKKMKGRWDPREYRKFVEALNFISH